MWELRFIVALSLMLGAPPPTSAQTVAAAGQTTDPNNSICSIIQTAARANGLPVGFFTRLIWQESRFRADEIGPTTRFGEHALGIAQFMPGTAAEHGLFEPFNPVEALPKSGEFLAKLRDQFGNLGLAAAAYNAGPQRVRDFLNGMRDLPLETRNYVLAITGRSVEDWVKLAKVETIDGFKGEPLTDQGTAGCEVMMLFHQASGFFDAEMLRRFPSWCRYLSHPNVNTCGPIHQARLSLDTSSAVRLRSHLAILRHHRADTLQPAHLVVR
jgi:hypothetical protein